MHPQSSMHKPSGTRVVVPIGHFPPTRTCHHHDPQTGGFVWCPDPCRHRHTKKAPPKIPRHAGPCVPVRAVCSNATQPTATPHAHVINMTPKQTQKRGAPTHVTAARKITSSLKSHHMEGEVYRCGVCAQMRHNLLPPHGNRNRAQDVSLTRYAKTRDFISEVFVRIPLTYSECCIRIPDQCSEQPTTKVRLCAAPEAGRPVLYVERMS